LHEVAGGMRIKGAILALMRAERHMNVKAGLGVIRHRAYDTGTGSFSKCSAVQS
jgi:hypothetical protein